MSAPTSRLQLLQQPAETGDIRAIEQGLDATEASGEPYPAFVRRMRELAAECDIGWIVDFIRTYAELASKDLELQRANPRRMLL